MAKNNNYNNKKDKEVKKEKVFRNPASSVWGKIIIGFLAIAMAFSGLISLIYLMITKG